LKTCPYAAVEIPPYPHPGVGCCDPFSPECDILRLTLAQREHQRGGAGAAAGTTRDRHSNTTTSAVGMRTRARRSRAQVFGAPPAASCWEVAPTTPKSALKILQKAQNATELRATIFASTFPPRGFSGTADPRGTCQHLTIPALPEILSGALATHLTPVMVSTVRSSLKTRVLDLQNAPRCALLG
jgi:hypothetical protein